MYKNYIVTFYSDTPMIYRIHPTIVCFGLQYLDIQADNTLDLLFKLKTNVGLVWRMSTYKNLEDLKSDAVSVTLIPLG